MEDRFKQQVADIHSELERVRPFTALNRYPEFLRWKKEVVQVRLDMLKETCALSDFSTEQGRMDSMASGIAYQQLKDLTVTMFEIFELNEQAYKEQLREYEALE